MNTALVGLIVAAIVIVGIYFLFVVPGERKYHETKLKLMQERIERHEQRQSKQASGSSESADDEQV